MTTRFTFARALATAATLALLLPAVLAAQTGRFAQANAVNGVVQSVNRQLNYLTVRDQATGRDVKIDVRQMDTRQSVNVWQLRPGDRIRADGNWEKRDTFRATRVGFSTGRRMTKAPGGPNALFGTVQSTNQRLNYLTIRDESSGRDVKIDVRAMDTSASTNVWRLRAGDPIVVNGAWSGRDTYRADRVRLSTDPSIGTAYGSANVITGTVQSTNRDLNYLTLRNEATGQTVKIDVRKMDARRSVNVWQLRPGDQITVDGTWESRDTFQADTVNF